MRNLLGITAVFCALVLCQCVVAEESAPSSTEHDRIKKLISELGSEDFETRQAASQGLLEIGEAAWPQVLPLLESKDAEVQSRATQLAKFIATTLTPADHEKSLQYITLLESKDANERAAGLDSLVSLGHAGMRTLKENVSGAGANLVLSLKLDKLVLTVDDKLAGTVTLINDSEHPLWNRKGDTILSSQIGDKKPFGEERPVYDFEQRSGGGRKLMVMRGRYLNPIRAWQAFTKTSEPQSATITKELTLIGSYDVRATATLPEPQNITPRLHPPKENETDNTPGRSDGKDIGTFELIMGAAWGKAEDRKIEKTQTVYVLPPLPAKNADDRLSLTLTRETSSDAKVCLVKATLTSLLKDETQKLESMLPKYAWYVILDAKNVPIKWGSWNSVLVGGPQEKFDERVIPAKQCTEWQLSIPLPEETDAKEYSILLGYEVRNTISAEEELRFGLIIDNATIPKIVDPDNKFKLYENGSLYAQLTGIKAEKK